MVLLCFPCHRAIHKDEITASRTGWLVWADPVTPVLHHHHGWVLLVPDGGVEHLAEDEALRLVDWVNGILLQGA